MPKHGAPNTIYLKDYTQPHYWVDEVDLRFEFAETETRVVAQLQLRRNEAFALSQPLVLQGQDVRLGQLELDGRTLTEDQYEVDGESLVVHQVPPQFQLTVETFLKPQENTSLEGLYKSSGNFCTQCEAEGFRKITYYPDRPDVLASFTTTLVADKTRYPVLLSNGNLVEEGALEDGRHWAKWHDPFKKPSYLFALVAGNLRFIEDFYTTSSGRQVTLRIYVEPHNIEKCDHAMRSLKNAMRWDEEVFGLEYDLDIYMIVAVDDFNMGAMENKGLNIFNSKYVLASPETATDTDYVNIEGVIGHEYFHNWTGNRVTCRDWFQLTLKEGLTVFRDQQFTGDMTSHAVKRIDEVNILRTHQFAEDAGAMAHPIQPDSYVEINNFYTATVYNKGAEVIRMIHLLLGEARFREGLRLYLQRQDGKAATTEDFVGAMEDVSGIDLGQFRNWYHQAGTPTLHVDEDYDAECKVYQLHMRQSCPPTPGQLEKQPFHIPVAVGMLDSAGAQMSLRLEGESDASAGTRVLHLHEASQTFRFVDVGEKPVASVLRNFSAPVKLEMAQSDAELAFLMAHDTDLFNRWDAGQRLASRIMFGLLEDRQAGRDFKVADEFTQAIEKILQDDALDKSLVAQALKLPDEAYLAEQMAMVDVEGIHQVREYLRKTVAQRLQDRLLQVYHTYHSDGVYELTSQAMGQRSLKNQCLSYLVSLASAEINALAYRQFEAAGNMTDQQAALQALIRVECPERELALASFYQRWRKEPLVLDKWFTLQASAQLPDALPRVKSLLAHPDFDIKNPNRVRSVLGAFCHANPTGFHDISGDGYRLLTDYIVELNAINPQIAARLLKPLARWKHFDPQRQSLMKQQLRRLEALPDLARDLYEVVSKSLS